MKKYLTILFLMISILGFSKSLPIADTITYWKVYNGDQLLKELNGYSKDLKIILTKGKIRAIDTLNVKYFDDTPCYNCRASLTIKTVDNKKIRTINNSKSNYDFDIKTTDLQILAAFAFEHNQSTSEGHFRIDKMLQVAQEFMRVAQRREFDWFGIENYGDIRGRFFGGQGDSHEFYGRGRYGWSGNSGISVVKIGRNFRHSVGLDTG